MPGKDLFKENLVLIVGLTLPVLLMIGFLIASSLPPLGDPPKYDLIFTTQDYQGPANLPVTVQLIVKDGVLRAQYVRWLPGPNAFVTNNVWKKLYIYEAGRQTVRELPFGLPAGIDKIEGIKEEVVEATKGMKLDTTLKAPDGYELTHEGYRYRGLVNDLLWNFSHSSNKMRLRKGATSFPLSTGKNDSYFYYGDAVFIGWVVGTN